MRVLVSAVAIVGALFSVAAFAETHSEIQAVDASGNATHPKVIRPGNPWSPALQVVMEGVIVAAPEELTDTASELLISFQGEGDDHAGTQIWSGAFFQDWPGPYAPYFGLLPGDRIRVTGYAAQFVGKVNINEQHSDDPAKDFVIEWIGHPGMPVPETVSDVATATTFDATRMTGGEYYQSRWVRMNNLTITTPETWQAHEEVTVTDGTGAMQMMLSATGDFDDYTPPTGPFDVVALFDQEPRPLDFAASRTGHYRLWVKRMGHILPPGAPFLSRAVSRVTHEAAGDFDIDVSVSGAVETRVQPQSALLLVVTFDRPVTGAGGLDASDVAVSGGSVASVTADDGELTVALTGVPQADNLTVQFPGIVSVANGAAVTQSLCFGVLRGDANADRTVNTSDYITVRGRIGLAVSAATFRSDVNADGAINTSDYVTIRGRIGNDLETECP